LRRAKARTNDRAIHRQRKTAPHERRLFYVAQPRTSYELRAASQRPEHAVLDDLPLHWPEPELADSFPLPLAFWSPRAIVTLTVPASPT
jgi:hypothetical protein